MRAEREKRGFRADGLSAGRCGRGILRRGQRRDRDGKEDDLYVFSGDAPGSASNPLASGLVISAISTAFFSLISSQQRYQFSAFWRTWPAFT
jgi:hypothetical protein